MKKYIALAIALIANIKNTYAQDLGIFGSDSSCAVDFRTGDINLDDIPCLLQGAINFFLGISGTIAIIFIIIGAYKILFGSLSQDTTKGKDTIIMALTGFAIATLSWFIIKLLLDNF